MSKIVDEYMGVVKTWLDSTSQPSEDEIDILLNNMNDLCQKMSIEEQQEAEDLIQKFLLEETYYSCNNGQCTFEDDIKSFDTIDELMADLNKN